MTCRIHARKINNPDACVGVVDLKISDISFFLMYFDMN